MTIAPPPTPSFNRRHRPGSVSVALPDYGQPSDGVFSCTGTSNDYGVVVTTIGDISTSYRGMLSVSRPLPEEFAELTNEWKRATHYESSPERMASHPAYQKIVGLGAEAVPFILSELQRSPDFWFDALTAVTGEQPIPIEHAGDVEAMAQDWVRWGEENGYL